MKREKDYYKKLHHSDVIQTTKHYINWYSAAISGSTE